MEMTYIVPILALLTMLAACIFALINQRMVEARRANPDAPKSTLAADKSSSGKPADI